MDATMIKKGLLFELRNAILTVARARLVMVVALPLVLLLILAFAAAASAFEGRRCAPPTGHRIVDCRIAKHGTPDLSRSAWRALRDVEVTISKRFDAIAPNPAANGARSWPMIDSLAQPMGTLQADPLGRMTVRGLDGQTYRVTSVRMRGHGCAASTDQQRRFALVQIIAKEPVSGGTQAFVDTAAIDQSTLLGRAALAAFAGQVGGGTGCGPAGREVGRLRALANPRVNTDPAAHARLRNGAVNDVKEYDAKPAFANIVYFMSNTTQVLVGGITRGMVRVGTPLAKVDAFKTCDPSSDNTLTWRYWSIRTGIPARPRLYGWIPGRCPARMR